MRKLIKKNESKISILQIIGFVLILLPVVYIIGKYIYNLNQNQGALNLTGEEIAVLFFIIMLGFAFAFPDLLQDQNCGLSTMRLVVFMMINVICMLLLKIGWNCNDLTSLGLDGYWMGVIAFVFGAKATQSFFENWSPSSKVLAQGNVSNSDTDVNVTKENQISLSGHELAQLAISDNEEILKTTYPNIVKLIPSYWLQGNNRIPCVDICIKDNNKQKVPPFLNYTDHSGYTAQIKTRVITNFGNVKPQLGRGDKIANGSTARYFGTVGCIVNDNDGNAYALTCNHVLTNNNFSDPGDIGEKVIEIYKDRSTSNIGVWSYGKMDNTVDAALISLANVSIDSNDLDDLIYDVTEDDSHIKAVELRGAKSNTQTGYIIHVNQPMDVDYKDQTVELTGLITISAAPNFFSPITQEGDSGALVYTSFDKEPIGIVLGANSQFTYAIPIRSILSAFTDLSLSITNN